MKTRSLALALVLALALTAVASAATHKLTGKTKGSDTNATISLVVKTNKAGTATKVSSFKVRKLTGVCNGGLTRDLDLSVTNIKVTKSKANGRTVYGFYKRDVTVDPAYTISGTFKSRTGTRVTGGSIDISRQRADGAVACRVYPVGYTAKVKR